MTTPMNNDLAARLRRYLRSDVQGMHAYAVQPSAGMVKVDTMENPFGLPPALRQQLGERLAEVALNRYPAERGDVLRAALARHAQMPDGNEIMLGNGSDELISLLAMAVANTLAGPQAGGAVNTVLAPVPGFVMYELSARLQGLRFVGVPTTADFQLDAPAMLAAIREHQPALVYLAFPNNPTANLWDDDAIEAIIEAAPGLVVMDEAYQPFASRDSLDRLKRHEHVLLMRTMSKFGLAGVRIGYLIGRKALIAEVDKLRPPFNISVLNCEAALFALEHTDEYARQAATIRSERARVFAALQALPGVTPFPERGQHGAGAGARCGRHLCRHEGTPGVDQERLGPAPAAGQLPAHHRGHTRRKYPDVGRPCCGIAGNPAMTSPTPRTADVQRDTQETRIRVRLNLDGSGASSLATGIGFFDHMLDQIARHGLIDLDIQAQGDLHIDGHHTVEDVGITLGQAMAAAVGDKKGLRRYGHAYVPLDEALSRVVVDFSGRPGLHMRVKFTSGMIGALDTQLVYEFFQGFVNHAGVSLHIDNLHGDNAHHQCETIFKAFARALRMALEIDPRAPGVIPSTKGSL